MEQQRPGNLALAGGRFPNRGGHPHRLQPRDWLVCAFCSGLSEVALTAQGISATVQQTCGFLLTPNRTRGVARPLLGPRRFHPHGWGPVGCCSGRTDQCGEGTEGFAPNFCVPPFTRPTRVSPSCPRYLSVSWRLLPRDKEIERKKPWTAGTVYIKRVLDKSCGNTRVLVTLLPRLSHLYSGRDGN